MPYTKAHYYMLLLLPVTVLAFWPSYFGMLSDAPAIHHLHGITGTLWILLIAAQSYSIHSRKLKLHRQMGKLVFILTPVMVGAFALVTWLGAQKSIGGHPFYEMFGHALLTGDAMLTFTTPLMVFLALQYRGNVKVHGALMISTVFGLLPPILARLINIYVPGLEIIDIETLYRFGYSLYISIAFTCLLALYLYFRYRANGWPWMLAAAVIALMWVLYETLGRSETWTRVVGYIGSLSPMAVLLFGLGLGFLACVMGWMYKKN